MDDCAGHPVRLLIIGKAVMKLQKKIQRYEWLPIVTCDDKVMWETALDNERNHNTLKPCRRSCSLRLLKKN